MGVQLYHGDCLDILPTLADASVDMVLCDLPYGTTACKWDVVIPFAPLWEQYRRVVKRNGAIVLFGSQPFTSLLITSNLPMFKYQWYWLKSNVTGYLNAKKQPLRRVEDVLVFYREQPTYSPQMKRVKDRYVSRSGGYSTGGKGYGAHAAISSSNGGLQYPYNALDIPSKRGELHPTQKPVALCEYLIRTYTNEGETVLDNTMGVGTTGVACVNTGRAFVGIEKDAGYHAIAKRRIQEAQQAARQLTLEGVA